MAIKFIPTIAEEDYDSFRSILRSDIPDAYHEWLNLAFRMSTNNIDIGEFVRPVEVKPDEFARYCEVSEKIRTLHGLEQFTHQKGVGNKY